MSLDENEEESEKPGLKLSIQKAMILASAPILSWQIEREMTETVTNIIFFGSNITADHNCSHEITGCLLLGRKSMTNQDSILKGRDSILKSKDITSPKPLHHVV